MIRRFTLPHVAVLVAVTAGSWAAAPEVNDSQHTKTWAVVSGTARDIRFEPVSQATGIPLDAIYQVLQDRRGFIWLTTRNGLLRYDGYQHVRYPGQPMARMQWADAIPGRIYEGRDGALWVTSHVLNRFDPATGNFTQFLKLGSGPERPGYEAITAIHEDGRGFLWLGVWSCGEGERRTEEISEPVLYEVDTTRRISIPHRINEAITHGQPVTIRAIEEDARGRMWLGTSIGLIRFDPSTGSFQHYPHTHAQAGIQAMYTFNALAWDKTGHLWVHMPAGLERFDPETGVFDRFTAATFWYSTPGPDGRLWLWGGPPGLKIFDPSGSAETALKTVSLNSAYGQPMEELRLLALGPDRNGNMWAYPYVGGALYRYAPGVARFGRYVPDLRTPNSLTGGEIAAFAEDADGFVWIASTYTGLNRFDPRTGTFTQFRHNPKDPNSLVSDTVLSLAVERSGSLRVATNQGIGTLDRKTGRYTPLRGSMMPHSVSSMLEDTAGRFWLTEYFQPVSLLDRRTGSLTPMGFKAFDSLIEDRKRNIWFTYPPFLKRLDSAGKVRSISLRDPDTANPSVTSVFSMYEDARGTLWLATNKGLYEFDPSTEKAQRYATAEGLATDYLKCMVPDRVGNLWMSTSDGISRFDPKTKRFENFDQRDGLQGPDFLQYSCLAARDGRLYFGGSTGFNTFYPQDVLPRPAEIPVVVTGFQINSKVTPVLEPNATRLKYWQNSLTFEFAALNHLNPGRIRYRFKLESYDQKWVEVDTTHRLARYTEVPPGEYVFRAEASSDGRSWSANGVSLPTTILPPWWRTWWAETVVTLLLLGSVLAAYKLRVRALHQRHEELAALVDQRTAELVIARDAAQSSNRAKSAFLANMSHELRTPLSAILGFSSLLRDSDLNGNQREQIDTISRSGEHLLGLINDVLDVAKIEAGKQELTVVPSDLMVTMRTVIEMMQVRADDRHLLLVYEQAPEVPRFVRLDVSKLRQILINLLGNSIKFTKEGGVKLRLSAVPGEDPRRVQLRFDVQDSGIGISQEDLGRIFDPFEQVRDTIEPAGTGLGLTITRRFVEMMGGTLRVESELGRGSRFVVDLPVELACESEMDGQELARRDAFLLAPGQPERRVLVVEDDAENASVLRQMLTRAGFSVRVAENGALGIEVFQEWRPHFIWMDIMMPQLTGTEATRRIRELDGGANVKIVAITASAYALDREAVTRAGFDDFAFKPIRPTETFGIMARHLGVRYGGPVAGGIGQASEPGVLRPEALAALPQDVRRRLKDSVTSLNTTQIMILIDEVERRDEALGLTLRNLGKQYAYTAILTAIERAESPEASSAPVSPDMPGAA